MSEASDWVGGTRANLPQSDPVVKVTEQPMPICAAPPPDQCPECRCAPGAPHATGCPSMEYVPIGHLDSVDTRHHAEQVADAAEWFEHEDAAENVLSYTACIVSEFDTGNPLIDSMAETFCRCLELAVAKNADYTAGADPFANFDRSAIVGCEPLRGLLVRVIDKVSRAGALVDADPHVAGESLADTFDDLVNYAAIGRAIVERDAHA